MSRPLRSAGFTLLELLITIGILVLLLAILLPVVGQVRDQSRTVQCASNMRQLVFATRQYAMANKEMLPLPALKTPDTGPQFAFSMPSSAALIDYQVGSLWRYIGGSADTRFGLLNCPADLGDLRPVSGPGSLQPRNFSYGFNHLLRGGVSLNVIPHPAEKIIVIEEEWPNDSCAFFAVVNIDHNDVPANRHGGRGSEVFPPGTNGHLHGRSNNGFVDGHVDNFEPIDLGFLNDYTAIADPVVQQKFFNLKTP